MKTHETGGLGRNTETEQAQETLSGKEKFEIVLKLFGTGNAQDSFLEVCRKYVALRVALPADAEHYHAGSRRTYSPPQRAILHNQIMDTLKRLSLQKLSPLSEKVLYEMADREVAGDIIKEWVLAHENEEDEDVEAHKRNNMSGTAYFHSLGNEY